MKKLTLIFLLMIGFFVQSFSQIVDETAQRAIDVQRPTQSESYSIVDRGTLQFELGSVYNKGYLNQDTLQHSVFIRYGVSDVIEFRFTNDIKTSEFRFGVKALILREADNIPGLSFVIDFNKDNNIDNFRFCLSKLFDGGTFSTVNFGIQDTTSYGIFLIGKSLSPKTSMFLEYYTQANQNQYNLGITRLVSNSIQLDASCGIIGKEDWFVGAGFAYRIR